MIVSSDGSPFIATPRRVARPRLSLMQEKPMTKNTNPNEYIAIPLCGGFDDLVGPLLNTLKIKDLTSENDLTLPVRNLPGKKFFARIRTVEESGSPRIKALRPYLTVTAYLRVSLNISGFWVAAYLLEEETGPSLMIRQSNAALMLERMYDGDMNTVLRIVQDWVHVTV